MVPYHSCGPRALSLVPIHCCLVLQLPHSMRLLGIFFYALPLFVDSKASSLLLYLAMLVTHGFLIFIIAFLGFLLTSPFGFLSLQFVPSKSFEDALMPSRLCQFLGLYLCF